MPEASETNDRQDSEPDAPARAATAGNLRFTRVHLENWKNFGTLEIALERRVFIVGANASGKSNFLDALRFLHDIARTGGGFQSAIAKRAGVSVIRNLSARRYPEIRIEVDIGTSEDAKVWTYDLAFTQDNNRVPTITREVVTHRGKKLLARPRAEDDIDAERLTQTSLEQVNANKPFRAISEFFNRIRYLHVVPQLIREPDRSVGRKDDPYGGDFLEQLIRTPEKTRASRLRRIQQALKIAVPQLVNLEMIRDEKGTAHLRGRYEHWRPKSGWQNEDQFSDGTLRLIGLLWSIIDGTGPLLLEEPELSLSSGVVKHIPALVYRMQRGNDRQVLMSTHSAEMFVDTGVNAAEVLLITPSTKGSQVMRGADIPSVQRVLAAKESLGEAIMPLTTPKDADQLALFGS